MAQVLRDLDGAFISYHPAWTGVQYPPLVAPTPDVYARDVAAAFPELLPVAALEMGEPVLRRIEIAPYRRNEGDDITVEPRRTGRRWRF